MIPSYNMLFLIGIAVLSFGFIRLRTHLDIVCNAFIVITVLDWPIQMMFTLNVMASMSKFSVQFGPNLQLCVLGKSRILQKYYRLKLRSCRPIRFHVGDYYPMKRNASLNMANSVVSWTNFLLVTIP